jgi:hypothetical protein
MKHKRKKENKRIEHITKDGFSLPAKWQKLSDLGLLSLRIALEAYFSTYQAIKYHIHLFEKTSNLDQDTIDSNHSIAYFNAYAETILHFHHFIELALKNLLRSEHPLLADIASTKPTVLYKLLKGEPLHSEEENELRSIEFKKALERVKELEGNFIDTKGLNIGEQYNWLEKLNSLRNRIWHRGTFVLRYPALDEFVGRYILPFVKKVVNLPEYKEVEMLWKYKELKCGIDPIEEIINSFKKDEYNPKKIAFFKELGRAAYKIPYSFNNDSWIGRLLSKIENVKRKKERFAEIEKEETVGLAEVTNCPVCGATSLVVFYEIEPIPTKDGNPMDGPFQKVLEYSYEVKCTCCTFNIDYELNNPSTYGLPIDDFFYCNEL